MRPGTKASTSPWATASRGMSYASATATAARAFSTLNSPGVEMASSPSYRGVRTWKAILSPSLRTLEPYTWAEGNFREKVSTRGHCSAAARTRSAWSQSREMQAVWACLKISSLELR